MRVVRSVSVATVYSSKVGQEVEIAESADVGVDPQVIGDLLQALQHSQLLRPHPRNVVVSVTETNTEK